MIHFAWPWMLLALPLPWLFKHYLPAAKPRGDALFLPFAATVSGISAVDGRAPSRRRSALFLLIWLLLVGAASRPQWLGEPLPVPTTGRRLMLAVDVSGSMATPDMADNSSRLSIVQKVAGDFVARRHGDQVGLILFGSRPYLQAPLTPDLTTVDQFLQQSVVGIAGMQTAIGDAIGLAIKRLREPPGKTGKAADNVLILLTDGGNDAGLMDPIAAAKMAATLGLRIYTIGVGAAAQAGFFGTSGNTDLDEGTLKRIAQITHGEYFRATDAEGLQQVYAAIDKLEPSAGHEQWYRPRSEWFTWPLAAALGLSLILLAIRERT